MSRNRWIVVIGIAALVIFAIVFGFLPKPVTVDIAKTTRGRMMVTVEEEGKTRVKDRYVISAPVAGYLRRVELDVGDPVKKGEVLAELESQRSAVLDPRSRAAAEAAVSAAEATLKAAEEAVRARAADAEYANANAVRATKLYKSGYISKDSMDQSEAQAKRTDADLHAARSAARSAQFDLDKARTSLGYSAAEQAVNRGKVVFVRAPAAGHVLKVYHESEGTVNSGDPLIDIGNPAALEVKVEVLSEDAVKIKPGMAVLFERWGGDANLSGRVRVVEPAGFTKISSLGVEEQRTLVIADITAPPESWQRLGDGYRVEARFVIWEGKDVLQVPASSLFRKGDEWEVFAVHNGKARLRPVQVGHRTGLAAEIVSGLSEGEEVIAHPDDSINDGTRVRPRKE
ncbi:MAG: efflux RND transporter periplasmic adaptor subunit [Nitrospiraceae bacterium]|nr:efflux RND transporter periplasmic adaptor subunit [Nitrospiraceae bacterium]